MKELHAQSLSNELSDSDRIASGIPGQIGAKNILVSKFILQIKNFFGVNNWVAREYKSSPSIVIFAKKQYILDETIAPLPFTSINFATELASGIWVPLESSITLASQTEAESNTENTKFLSSLRTFQNWIYNVKNYAITELNTVSKTLVGAINWLRFNFELLKDPTGFRFPSQVVVSYDALARTITLTGNCEAYFRGNLVSAITSGYVSAPHAVGNGTYFLHHDGTSFVWLTMSFSFDMIMIAVARVGAFNVCLREPHGFMNNLIHEEFHDVVGTYLKNGGDIANYTLGSTTLASRRPLINSATIKDEDLISVLAGQSSNYTRFNLTGAGVATETLDSLDIIALLADNPYYNQFTGGAWVQTLLPINAYGKIFVMAIPTTSDISSAKKRFVFIQPQTASTTLSTIQAITASSVNLGDLASGLAEYVFIGEIIVRYATNNWTLISVAKILGSRVAQSFFQGAGAGGGHAIKDISTTFAQRAGLKFIGNVAVTDDLAQDNTVVEFLGLSITKQYQVATTGATVGLLSFTQLEKIVAIPTKYNVDSLKLTPVLGGADIILITGGVVATLPINLAIATYNFTVGYSVGTSSASFIIDVQKQ